CIAFPCMPSSISLRPPRDRARFPACEGRAARPMAAAPGLSNALYTALAAAETAEHYLSNAADVPPSYERAIADIWNTYAERLAFWYSTETRWDDRPFWRRRLEAAP